MPKINTNFYNPQTKGRVVYPKEMVEAIRKNTIVLPNGKRISRAELEQGYAANQGTLTDLGGKPSTDTRTSTQRNADYLHPIKGIVERQKSEWDNGKHPVQGLAKTVGASAALATGAAYSSPVVGTWSALGKNLIAGAVGMEGYAMLEGRPATNTELATGVAMEMGMPIVAKGTQQVITKLPSVVKNIEYIPKKFGKAIDRYQKVKKLQNMPREEFTKIYSEKTKAYQNFNHENDKSISILNDIKHTEQEINNSTNIDYINKAITANTKVPKGKSISIQNIFNKPAEVLKSAEKKGILNDMSVEKKIHSFDDNTDYSIYEQNVIKNVSPDAFINRPYENGILNVKLNKDKTVSQNIPDGFAFKEKEFIGDGVKDIVRRNVAYLEKLYPNSKVIGSPALIDTKGFNRLPKDYDLTTTKMLKVDGLEEISSKARYGKTFVHQNQEIDINLATNKEYARDLSKFLEAQGIKKQRFQTDAQHVKENFQKLNSTQKTLFDKAQSIKDKHVADFNELVVNGDGKEILDAIELRNKVLFKELQSPNLDFKNIESNKIILDKLGIKNNVDILASDENKMRAIISDFYLKQTSYGRGLYKNSKIKAIYEYKNKTKGAEQYGLGQYGTVGNSKHNTGSYGYVHEPLENNASTEEFVDKLISSRSNKNLSDSEKEQVKLLLEKHNVNSPKEISNISSVLSGLSKRDMKDAKSFLNEFANIVGQKGYYPGNKYGNGNLYLGFKDVENPILNYSKKSANIADGEFLGNPIIGNRSPLSGYNSNKKVADVLLQKLSRNKVVNNAEPKLERRAHYLKYSKEILQRLQKEYGESLKDVASAKSNLDKTLKTFKTDESAYIYPKNESEHRFNKKISELDIKYYKAKNDLKKVGYALGIAPPVTGLGKVVYDIMDEGNQSQKLWKEKIDNDVKAVEIYSGEKFVYKGKEGESNREKRSRMYHQKESFIDNFINTDKKFDEDSKFAKDRLNAYRLTEANYDKYRTTFDSIHNSKLINRIIDKINK